MRQVILMLTILFLTATAVGCTGTGPKKVEADFGNSVRQMVSGQTMDREAAENPDPDGPDSGDGDRLNNVLESYRGDVAKPEEVGQPIVINAGG